MARARLLAIPWRQGIQNAPDFFEVALTLHGTWQVSALARLGCAVTMTASKMHVGHLESAAGAVGLLKASYSGLARLELNWP